MEFIDRNKDVADVNQLSPLVWAYVGDSVYEMFIRTNLVNNSNAKPHRLHLETIKFVKAKAQADTLSKIKDNLTEKEKEIVRSVEKVEDIVNIGDELECRVAEIDAQGRINLVRNDIVYDDESMPVRRPPRRDGERGDRGGRGGDRGPRGPRGPRRD